MSNCWHVEIIFSLAQNETLHLVGSFFPFCLTAKPSRNSSSTSQNSCPKLCRSNPIQGKRTHHRRKQLVPGRPHWRPRQPRGRPHLRLPRHRGRHRLPARLCKDSRLLSAFHNGSRQHHAQHGTSQPIFIPYIFYYNIWDFTIFFSHHVASKALRSHS